MSRKPVSLGTVHEDPAEDPTYVTHSVLSQEDRLAMILSQYAIEAAINRIVENPRVLDMIQPLIEPKPRKTRQLVKISEFDGLDFSEIKRKNAKELDFGFIWQQGILVDEIETDGLAQENKFAPLQKEGYASISLLKKDFEAATLMENKWAEEQKYSELKTSCDTYALSESYLEKFLLKFLDAELCEDIILPAISGIKKRQKRSDPNENSASGTRRRSLAASKIGSIAKKLGDQTKKVDQKLKNLREKSERDEFEELKDSLSSRRGNSATASISNMGQSVQHATSASVKKASSKLKNLGQGLGKGITKMKKDTSEASSNFKAKIQSQKAGSTKSKNPTSPTKGEPLLDISDVDSDIDDLDTQQFLEDPAIKKYKNSFKHIGNDPENVPIFMLTARDLPSEKLINYEDISNRLADYAQEQLALLEAPNYTVYFVTGMAKGENMPSLKTSERLRLRWSSKKTLKKLFFIHLGVKNNIYISRLMSSLSEETKSKLIKCTKTKSLEKYGHNSKLPLPIDLANYDKNV